MAEEAISSIAPAAVLAFAAYALVRACFPRAHATSATSPPSSSLRYEADESALPSAELGGAVRKLKDHVAEDQVLAAGALLLRLQKAIAADPAAPAARAAARELAGCGVDVVKLCAKYAECKLALKKLLGEERDWKAVYSIAGIETCTRTDERGVLWVKTEGVVKGVQLHDLIATWREATLYPEWVPNCHASGIIKEFGRSEILMWFAMRFIPTIYTVVLGYGVDALDLGYLLIVGKSTKQSDWPDETFPKLSGLRLHFAGLQVLVEPVGPNEIRSCLVAALSNSETALPNWILDFIIKYLLGVLFYLQAKVAQRIHKQPEKSPHAKMIASKPAFYRDWICVKVDRYRLSKGWIK